MRNAIACLMLVAIPAWAADPPTKPAPPREAVREAAKPGPACAECGVVRSVKVIRKEIKVEQSVFEFLLVLVDVFEQVAKPHA